MMHANPGNSGPPKTDTLFSGGLHRMPSGRKGRQRKTMMNRPASSEKNRLSAYSLKITDSVSFKPRALLSKIKG